MGVGGAYLSTVEGFVRGVVIVEEEHVDEGDEDAGSVPGGARSERQPLIKDEDDEVAEEAGHEDDLWDEPEVDVQRPVEVPATHRDHEVTEGSLTRRSQRTAGTRRLTGG